MKPNLLLVDDEERILRSLAMLFRPTCHVMATTDPGAALDHLRNNRVHVVVSDQRMPVMRGAELLKQAHGISPNTMRILLTGYAELDAIVASVNEGEVFRFVSKPWDSVELRRTVEQAAGIAQSLFDAGLAAPTPMPGATTAVGGEAILAIDEDPESLRLIEQAAPPGTEIHVATNLDDAFAALERHRIGVVVAELTVRGESVALALKMLKARHPELVSIVLTPFQDTQTLIELINQGQIYRYLPKPIRRTALSITLASALRRHRALRAAPVLRQVHVVEEARSGDQARLASRVLSYLSRLRLAT